MVPEAKVKKKWNLGEKHVDPFPRIWRPPAQSVLPPSNEPKWSLGHKAKPESQFSPFLAKRPGHFFLTVAVEKWNWRAWPPIEIVGNRPPPSFTFLRRPSKRNVRPGNHKNGIFEQLSGRTPFWAPIKKTAGATRVEPPIHRGNRSWGPSDPNENSHFTCLPPKFHFFFTFASGTIQIDKISQNTGPKNAPNFTKNRWRRWLLGP